MDIPQDLQAEPGAGSGIKTDGPVGTITGNTADPAPGSILAGLHDLRDEIAQQEAPKFTLDIPGWGEPSALAAIYRYPDGGYKAAMNALEQTDQGNDPDARLHGACALLVACCASVVFRRGDEYADLLTDAPLGEDQIPEQPLRFDRKLADALQIEVPDGVSSIPRFVCRAVFSPRAESTGIYDGDLGLIARSNAVLMWLNGRETMFDERLLGK